MADDQSPIEEALAAKRVTAEAVLITSSPALT